MNRGKIIKDLLKEGFTEKTLLKFSDKSLFELHEKVVVDKDKLKNDVDLMAMAKDPEIEVEVQEEPKGKKKKKDPEVKGWVKKLAEDSYHPFTSKNEIMELIQTKVKEQASSPSIKPSRPAPVKEPGTRPGQPKRENPFEPKHVPKPKAGGSDPKKRKLPEFLKFDKLGIKFKNEK